MGTKPWPIKSMALLVVIPALHTLMASAASQAGSTEHGRLAISRAAYLDRAKAIWTGQMIGQMTGGLFEHKVASVLKHTPLLRGKGFAPVGMDGIRRRLRTLPEHPDPEGDPGGLAGGRGMTGDNERDGVAARRKGVDFAIENTRLSGGTVSMEARRLLEEWVTGKLTDDELLAASALGKRPTKTLPAAPVEPADEIEEENGK